LVSLVEQLIAKEPYEIDGFKWAAQPQTYYCEKLSTSTATLRRRIVKPPFVRAWKMVGAQIVTVGEDTTVIGGKKLCILRIGVAPPKDVADEAKRVMIGESVSTKLKSLSWIAPCGRHARSHWRFFMSVLLRIERSFISRGVACHRAHASPVVFSKLMRPPLDGCGATSVRRAECPFSS
jgi:hypothetical protein